VEPRPLFLFLTGKLAEGALRRVLARIEDKVPFRFSVQVLPISVAALATTSWIARHFKMEPGVDRIILPGLCQGNLETLQETAGVPVDRGPNDLQDLPEFFRAGGKARAELVAHDITILAEINHAPRLGLGELLKQARELRDAGADVIDLGCDPDGPWLGVTEAVLALRGEGHRVSIDSFDPVEVARAVSAGAELVLSVNGSNARAARDWGVEVVAIPDVTTDLNSLDATVEILTRDGVQFRIDPILEPIGMGFAASLGRYLDVRRRYPNAEMMMGVGNITELTDADSAGINVILLGFCQEQGIRSVLTTQVINWSRSSVRELDLARRLVFHAWNHRVVPKRLEPRLILLRDDHLRVRGEEALQELARQITDPNYRLFAEGGEIHIMNHRVYLRGSDPFELFARLSETEELEPSHAFYLGYEMAKALTSLTLGKNYTQDRALNWGFLTQEEKSHRSKRQSRGGPKS